MNFLKHLIAFAFLLGMSSMATAAIPPPPVNQNLGIPDSSFNNYDQALCQACHWASYRNVDPINGAPVKKGYNPSRHHMALNTPIDGNPEFPPFRDGDGDGSNDAYFTCFNCHIILSPGDIDTAVLADVVLFNYRNCLNCHKRQTGPLTIHHATDLAQTGFCFKCHGGLVRGIDVDLVEGKRPDPNDVNNTVPVAIPDYPNSMITPWRSGKPNGDDNPALISVANKQPGNCNYCHNSDTEGESNVLQGDGGTAADWATKTQAEISLQFGGGVPETVTLPNGSTFTVNVLTNAQNHHNTGFFDDQRCVWCHYIDGNFQMGGQAIRACQRCHDRSTLHNIEFDAVGDGITPGQEEPFFGHIGNAANCWGCHGNDKTEVDEFGNAFDPRENLVVSNQGIVISDIENARNSISRSIIPTIGTLSTQSIRAGEEVQMTITGQSIVNSGLNRVLATDENGAIIYEGGLPTFTFEPITWSSAVVITDNNDHSFLIEASYQDTNKLEFTLPGTLAPGTYQVSLKKEGGQVSNPIGIIVTPTIRAQESFVYTPIGGLAILTGSNFMESVQGRTYKIVDQNGQAPLAIYLWRDDLVIALFNTVPESVTIENVFDKQTIPLNRY